MAGNTAHVMVIVFSLSLIAVNVRTSFGQPIEVKLLRSIVDEFINITLPTGAQVVHEQDEYFVVDIQLGNPPQHFNVSLDANVYWTTVLAKDIEQFKCQVNPGVRRFFDSSRSTTFRSLQPAIFNLLILIDFNTGCHDFSGYYGWTTGNMATDDLNLGNSAIASSQEFFLTNKVNGTLAPQLAADGLLGLNRFDTSAGSNATDSTIITLAKSAGDSVVSFYFVDPTAEPSSTGIMTIGGKDQKRCNSAWKNFGIADLNAPTWNVQLNGLTVGSIAAPNASGAVIFDASTSWISLSTLLVEEVVGLLGGSLAADGLIVVDCAKIPQLPDLTLTLNTLDGTPYDFVIPAKDYIRNLVPRTKGECTVLIRPMTAYELLSSDYGATFVIGTSGGISHCWAYDYGNKQLSVAEPNGN
jgi:hypothetical protein